MKKHSIQSIIILLIAALAFSSCSEPKKGSVEYDKLFNDNLHQFAQKHPEDGEANFLYGLVSDDARESEQAWRDAIFHGYDNPAINTYLGLLYWGVLKKQNEPTDLEQAHYYLKKAVSQDTGNIVPYILLKVLENGAENEAQKKYPKVGDLLPQTQYRYLSFYSKDISKATVCTLQRSGQLNTYNSLDIDVLASFSDFVINLERNVVKAAASDDESPVEVFQQLNQTLEKSLNSQSELAFPDLAINATFFIKIMERGIATSMSKREVNGAGRDVEVLKNEIHSLKEKIVSLTNLVVSILELKHTDNPRWQSVLEIQKTCTH